MAGGTWTSQNKVRPGAYVNYTAEVKGNILASERGVVTLPINLPWGEEKTVIEISSAKDLKDKVGIDIFDESALLIREALKGARKVLIYRVNSGKKSTATLENLTIEAKYTGEKGNDITIVIQNSIDDEDKFEVITLFENIEVDTQIVGDISELKENSYVVFKGTGELIATAGVPLTGGETADCILGDYLHYLEEIEKYKFNTIALPVEDDSLKALGTSFVKRLREDEGVKVQLVVANYKADYEGVISVLNGVVLSDNTVIDNIKATAYIAGVTAGADTNESLTYAEYTGAVKVDIKFSGNEIEKALREGYIVFEEHDDEVLIEKDINTLTTFANNKTYDFSKNRVLRVLDGWASDVNLTWSKNYIGKIDNDEDGRNLFKKDIIKLAELYQSKRAITNFTSEDVEVVAGNDKDAVLVTSEIQPVDSMEKLYMTMEVK